MTTDHSNQATPPQLSARDRHAILEKVLAILEKRFYRPEKLDDDWRAAVNRHRPLIEAADTADAFEQCMSDLLAELHVSHLGFFHGSARRASSRAALSATYLADETPFGKRWIFQDVHSGGAASNAGIEPGDILLSVDGREIAPPEHPVFAMGKQTGLEIIGKDDQIRLVAVDVARPKGKKLHFVEPTLVEVRHLENGLGYLKVAMFPGMVGVEVANEITRAIEKLGKMDSLIIDLRGNTGGGIGALRIMSLLTPDRVPVGFALDRNRVTPNLDSEKQQFRRFHAIPASKKALWPLALKFAPAMLTNKPVVLETEGLGRRDFHGNVILLVDRHTASAAEMIVAFARENNLARIVGENTAGRLLSATSVKVGQGFRLALPTGAYYTWRGSVLEGTPIEPDELVEFDWRGSRGNKDRQLEYAIESVSAGQSR
ncbi:S41 family peptidase [Acidicapsa acidisoli]|uniref:S41 family peptidase n=1 Tax=Acidicapsa acidisoli TaxID=1615681 RepID=UPI0021DF7116|nr:S41 family peptidase [Acidicapsa acidisoli]